MAEPMMARGAPQGAQSAVHTDAFDALASRSRMSGCHSRRSSKCGRPTDWEDKLLDFASDGRVLAAAAETLHAEALKHLNSQPCLQSSGTTRRASGGL
jgi:hypothetical protein